eukprot:GFYU01033299.1.p1 GENE.GFYU01033299.1~~GFYU01033299.1.p1  ORF type:complete len:282 (-),score=63.44 GFYU01033299.1:85-840(-)
MSLATCANDIIQHNITRTLSMFVSLDKYHESLVLAGGLEIFWRLMTGTQDPYITYCAYEILARMLYNESIRATTMEFIDLQLYMEIMDNQKNELANVAFNHALVFCLKTYDYNRIQSNTDLTKDSFFSILVNSPNMEIQYMIYRITTNLLTKHGWESARQQLVEKLLLDINNMSDAVAAARDECLAVKDKIEEGNWIRTVQIPEALELAIDDSDFIEVEEDGSRAPTANNAKSATNLDENALGQPTAVESN